MHHTFSRRVVLAIALLLVAACDQPDVLGVSTDTQADGPGTTADVVGTTANLSVAGGVRLRVGDTATLSARALLSRDRVVRWTSSAPTVASVSSTGFVRALRRGSSRITASGGGASQHTALSVVDVVAPPAAAASVTIANATSSLVVGARLNLVAVVYDASGRVLTGRTVRWSRQSGSAAVITADGVMTGVTTGAVAARATVENVVAAKSFTVTSSVLDAPAAPIATSFTVSPKTGATLAPGATRQFSTGVTWSDGLTRSTTTTYSATGGTISTNGIFTAGQLAGAFLVVANCGCGRADSATVNILQPVVVAQLATLAISPATTTLGTGATTQFNTTASWTTGATTLPPLTYTATGGSITSAGLYTAPTTPGLYSVIVAHTGGTLRDTSLVTVTAPPVTLTAITLAPASVTMSAGTSLQFAVSPTWSNGATTAPPVTYSATGGSITAAGLYTAPATAGTYRVIAAHTGGALRDTAVITVPTVAVTLTSMSLTPLTATVVAGATRQFAVSGVWSNGTTAAPAVTYSTNGGSINASGVYLAPPSEGTYTVIAAHTGGTLRDTSVVTVTAAPVVPPSPPPPPPSGGSNEPPGMTVLIDRSFSAKGEGGWYDENVADYTIVQDPTAPFSPNSVGEQRFRAGFGGGDSPAATEKSFSGKSTVYIAYYVKLSSNWVGHSSLVNKQMFIWTGGQPAVFTNASGSGSGTLYPEVRTQGTGGNVNLGPNLVPSTTFTRGVWHKWEIRLTANTAGAADGVCEFWFDGVKIGYYTNIRYNSGASPFSIVQWSPIWGGVGSSVPADQFMWVDHLYISGK